MTTTKATNIWPTQGLDESLVQNNKPDNSDVARALAGNAAAVIGYAHGRATLDDYTQNPAPLCPGHGRRGHDHSGGLFGYPLRRTVSHFDTGNGHEAEPSTDVDGNENEVEPAFSLGATASQTDDQPLAEPVFVVHVPGGDPGSTGAYPLMGIVVVGLITTATNVQAGDELFITIKNKTTGSVITVSDASVTAATLFRAASTGTDDLMAFAVGVPNVLQVKLISFTATAAAASRTIAGYISSIEVGVWLS